MIKLIFLDFDGVLHPDRNAAMLFEHVARLARELAAYPQVRVVVSSSWRSGHAYDELLCFLAPVADRVIGVTPALPGISRQGEIEAWLVDNARKLAANDPTALDVKTWLAIDDMPRLFQPGCPWLLCTNPKTGFDQKAWAFLQAWLESGELPSEVAVEGRHGVKHSFSRARDFIIDYRLFHRSKRLELQAQHLDTHLLGEFLFRDTLALGLEDLWCDDDQRYMPNRSDWYVTLALPNACFELEAVQLTRATGGHRTLMLKPLATQVVGLAGGLS